MTLATMVCLLAGTGVAFAQATGPAVGVPLNEQEPRPGVVQQREREAGIREGAAQSRAQEQSVDQLYRELTGTREGAPQPPVPLPGLGNPRQEAKEEDQLYRDLMGTNPNAPARPPR